MEIPEEVLNGKGCLSPTHYVLKKLVREQCSYRITLNNIVELAQICLTQPLSNAVVERGCSAVKRVKTRLRNSLKNDMLASLLHITINGPGKKSEDASKLLTEATLIWHQTRVRNLPKVTLPKVGGCDSMGGAQGTMSVATTDTSVQTEDIQVADAVKQVDLDMAAKVAADIVLRALDVEDCGSEPDSDCGMDYD